MKYQSFFDDGRQAFLDGVENGRPPVAILILSNGLAKADAYTEGWTKQMLFQPVAGWAAAENEALRAAQLASW